MFLDKKKKEIGGYRVRKRAKEKVCEIKRKKLTQTDIDREKRK